VFLASSAPLHSEGLAQQCARYFEALTRAHSDMLAELRSLERLTNQPELCGQYGAVRWRLAQASLNRRAVWNSIYARLIGCVRTDDATHLRSLQAADIELLRLSTGHIARWSPAVIAQDWPGYCKASRRLRPLIEAQIHAEKRMICPMLQRYSAAA
jgi:hypothetical protein